MFDRVAAAAITTTTMAAVGAASSPENRYEWVGQLMPVIIGVVMVVLVRAIIDMNAPKKRKLNYNLIVITLCSLFTGVFVHEYSLTAGQATLFGMGVGATGVGIISFGKPVLLAIVGKVQEGLKTPPAI